MCGHRDDSQIVKLGSVSITDDGTFIVESNDPQIYKDLRKLVQRQVKIGGFVRHYSRYGRSGDDPKAHVTYVAIEKPGSRYFADALKDTAARHWTGKRLGCYMINGFVSYVEP